MFEFYAYFEQAQFRHPSTGDNQKEYFVVFIAIKLQKPNTSLDATDWKILSKLQDNARIRT